MELGLATLEDITTFQLAIISSRFDTTILLNWTAIVNNKTEIK